MVKQSHLEHTDCGFVDTEDCCQLKWKTSLDVTSLLFFVDTWRWGKFIFKKMYWKHKGAKCKKTQISQGLNVAMPRGSLKSRVRRYLYPHVSALLMIQNTVSSRVKRLDESSRIPADSNLCFQVRTIGSHEDSRCKVLPAQFMTSGCQGVCSE